MLGLGIESSCDDTGFAVVDHHHRVIVSEVASQIDCHRVFGGVVPEIAAREHLQVLLPLYKKTMEKAEISIENIDYIAVTAGPGLVGSLLVGVSFAKGLALATGKPLIPVDHVHGHVHSTFLDVSWDIEERFPALALVVSGGHTNLYWMRSPLDFSLVASTIDDACGESFDKVAKMLGMEYPGGAKIESWAQRGDPKKYPMPIMMKDSGQLQFSYSGLKTHVVYLLQRLQREQGEVLSESTVADVCASFQEEALGQIIRKTKLAMKKYPNAKSLLVAGGVAASTRLRERLNQEISIPSFFPQRKYCMDNAAMIAIYGGFLFRNQDIDAHQDLAWDVYSRYRPQPGQGA
jgi:N6-L-threonylcarbamoyladenine synthase